MDVEQWWNNTESGKMKDPEETFISTTCSTTFSKSTRLVLSWATAARVILLSCGLAMKRVPTSVICWPVKGHFN